jgi:hypothetical protein
MAEEKLTRCEIQLGSRSSGSIICLGSVNNLSLFLFRQCPLRDQAEAVSICCSSSWSLSRSMLMARRFAQYSRLAIDQRIILKFWPASMKLDTRVTPRSSASMMQSSCCCQFRTVKKKFKVNGEKMTPGIAISNSEVGLASLSVFCFIYRIVCSNRMISKTAISASYRYVSTKILTELPQVFERVADGLSKQKDRLKLSLESPVADPLMTIGSFNHQFALGEMKKSAVEWGWQ